MNLIDRALTWAVRRRTGGAMTSLPTAVPWFGGNPLPPLSHGYVHEPFPGAWQMNQELCGPGGIFSAVYACIAIISGDIAKLPPKIRKRLPDGSKIDFDQHPAAKVLWYPNPYQTRVDFWGQFLASALFTGNAYALLVRDERGVIAEMHLLDPRRITPMIADDGSVFYRVAADKLAGIDEGIVLPARAVMHHRLLTLAHPLVGVTPLYAAGVSALTGQTILQNSHAFFSNMSRPSGVITVPGKLEESIATRLRTEWNENFRAAQMGRTAVLTAGAKWEPLTMTAVDAQLVEQLKWSVEDVARCFRVPLYMLADQTRLSFKNAEQLARTYYSQTLQYHIESVQARIDVTFGLSESIYCEFDLSAFLKMEYDARMAAHQIALNAGIKTINEVRHDEELPPKEGGDEPLVQMQYRPLSMAGEPVPTAGAPGAPTDPSPPDDPVNPDEPSSDEETPPDGNAAALVSRIRARALERWAA
jgi:HK97 family phage portal protein